MAGAGLEAGSTINLVLRLRGGKGGFGSLLRSAGAPGTRATARACCWSGILQWHARDTPMLHRRVS